MNGSDQPREPLLNHASTHNPVPATPMGGLRTHPDDSGGADQQPLRLLVVISLYLPAYSGAAFQEQDLLKRLGTGKIQATVLTMRFQGSPRRETLDGVRILRLGIAGTHALARLSYAIETVLHVLVRGRAYDLIHAFASGWSSFLVPLVARLLAVPAFYTSSLQGSDDAVSIRSQKLGGIKTRLMRLYRTITANTPEQVKCFADSGYPAGSGFTLTCGVDDRYYVPGSDAARRATLRRAAGRNDEGPVILFIGTLVRRKGPDLLVEAFRHLLGRHPSAVLVLMGPRKREEDAGLDEAFVQELQARCETGELRNHVAFLGRVNSVEQKRSILQASDVFALFSEYEGLGVAVLEAMACGLPPVLTPLPGVFDYMVEDGINGCIATSRDPSVLGEALHSVLASEDRHRAMGREARGMIERRFSLDLIASQYLGLCRRLAGRGSH